MLQSGYFGAGKLCLALFLLTLNGLEARDRTSYLYEPDSIQEGEWDSEDFCPSGSFVIGMRLKVENYQGGVFGDDTALNDIIFYCAAPWKTQLSSIWSHGAEWGEWKSAIFCPAFQFAVGFELKQDQTEPGIDDNAGAVNLALYCSRDYGTDGLGDGVKWNQVKRLDGQGIHVDGSEWTGNRFCDKNSAICSIQTKVERPQGDWRDDSGLVTMATSCCHL